MIGLIVTTPAFSIPHFHIILLFLTAVDCGTEDTDDSLQVYLEPVETP